MQWVRTSWTKKSRGGEAAARRNAVPVGYLLPRVPDGGAHLVRTREDDGFVVKESVVESRKPVPVRLREVDGRLRVLPHVDPLYGIPPRPRRLPAVNLQPGQWVRWQLNYRFSSAAGVRDWSYWLDTFNIAYGPVAPDAFLGEPSVYVDERGPVR